jgi:hypothetical protein
MSQSDEPPRPDFADRRLASFMVVLGCLTDTLTDTFGRVSTPWPTWHRGLSGSCSAGLLAMPGVAPDLS